LSTNISIGFSQDPNPKEAILQACVQVKNQLNTSNTDLIIIFASPTYVVPEILPVIARTLKPKNLIGSSTGGIILSNGVTNRGIALLGINSDEMNFGISAINELGTKNIRDAGFELARKASLDLKKSHREAFLIFAEGIEQDNLQFISGVKESLGIGFPILGAISSDDFKYKKLSQFFQDQILQHSAVGLLLGGNFHMSIGSKQNFKPLGKPRTITKTDGYIIRTIDHKPAIDIYKHFLGDKTEGMNTNTLNSYAAMYPLGIYLEESNQYLLRNIIDILEDGSIVCHGGFPVGAEVHLMISNKDLCFASAIKAAEYVKASLAEKPIKLLLIFESLARHKILGRSAFKEIQAIKDVLGQTIPILGMCSYGEIGPYETIHNIKNIYLHNESIHLMAIS